MASAPASLAPQRHPSPNLGVLAVVSTVLFCAGLYPVSPFGGGPSFPTPFASPQIMVSFFQLRAHALLLCAFLQFGSAIPLGIFTAAIVSRLRFLGVRAAGAYIALFGGFAATFALMVCSMVLWAMAHPGIVQETALTQALYFFSFGLAGPGYAVSLGLLMAGVSVPALFGRLVPRWIAIVGLALAVIGALSWFSLVFPHTMFLIPLTRFLGFLWMIAVGFAMPTTAAALQRKPSV